MTAEKDVLIILSIAPDILEFMGDKLATSDINDKARAMVDLSICLLATSIRIYSKMENTAVEKNLPGAIKGLEDFIKNTSVHFERAFDKSKH